MQVDATTVTAMAKLLRLSVVITATLIALPTMGIEITALLAAGGVGGIAIGFATAFVFCLGYHMLEQLGAPHLPMIYATVPLGFGWAIGAFIVAYRHR